LYQTGDLSQVMCTGTCGVSIWPPHTEPVLMTATHPHTVRLITLQSTPKEHLKHNYVIENFPASPNRNMTKFYTYKLGQHSRQGLGDVTNDRRHSAREDAASSLKAHGSSLKGIANRNRAAQQQGHTA